MSDCGAMQQRHDAQQPPYGRLKAPRTTGFWGLRLDQGLDVQPADALLTPNPLPSKVTPPGTSESPPAPPMQDAVSSWRSP
jgi:hypothetical protein